MPTCWLSSTSVVLTFCGSRRKLQDCSQRTPLACVQGTSGRVQRAQRPEGRLTRGLVAFSH